MAGGKFDLTDGRMRAVIEGIAPSVDGGRFAAKRIVGGEIVYQRFLSILAGVVFAPALAFGPGGKDAAAEVIERWWPRRGKKDGGWAAR